MNDLNGIYEFLDNVLPKNAEKVIFFCEVEDKSQEIFFYAFFNDGVWKQCYEMAEQGEIDENILDMEFDKMADFIRNTSVFDAKCRNVVTITIDGTIKNVCMEKKDKKDGLYHIKKEWKAVHLCSGNL